MKSKETTETIFLFVYMLLNSYINQLLFTEPSDPENLEVDLEMWEPSTEPLASVNVLSPMLAWSVELTQ